MADLIEGTYATGRGVFRPGEPPSDPSSSEGEDDFIDPVLLQPLPSSISTSSTAAAPSLPIVATSAAAIGSSAPTPAAIPSADTTASGKRSRNGHRKSGSQAIEGVASSINRLADALAADTAVPSPARKRAAIHAVEDDGDLSDDEQLRVFKIIH
jgi:hypothetical protein